MDKASSSTDGSSTAPAGDSGEPSTSGCPICEFIEAGPCGAEHKGEAKEKDADFVQHCGDTFRSFFGCMLSHQDYHKPFLEAFHVDTELSQEAIDKANAKKQQQHSDAQQQAPQHMQPAANPPAQQQQQQQSPRAEAHPPAASAAAGAAGSSSSAAQQGLQGHHTPAAAIS